ncbi:uncharacterized protein LOC123203000 [Mangifera indica]|uniref:uncharacterized protein LOC123203000 n=1 Tax=Mangifera indica TaxID=29780 RepID=UPI001CFB0E5B|nr:uncharacterized protein LOC123203000 [Mangifera indica]
MEFANKLSNLAIKAVNSDAVVNTFLAVSLLAITVRSVNQQKDIKALESEKESLVNANKAIKKTMWDWKQQLFAEAASESLLVPLATLKSIYGEAPTPSTGEAVNEESKPSAAKFVV